MKYTVEINPGTTDESEITGLNENDAIEQAKLYAADGDQVFVTFYRDSDGQHGYLNRDGHSPVGKAW